MKDKLISLVCHLQYPTKWTLALHNHYFAIARNGSEYEVKKAISEVQALLNKETK